MTLSRSLGQVAETVIQLCLASESSISKRPPSPAERCVRPNITHQKRGQCDSTCHLSLGRLRSSALLDKREACFVVRRRMQLGQQAVQLVQPRRRRVQFSRQLLLRAVPRT